MTYTPESIKACNEAFIASIRQQCATEEDFNREYLCTPSKLAQLVSGRDYDALLCKEEIPAELDHSKDYHELYVGVDIGRSHDLTVVWVWERGYDPSPDTPDWKRDVFRPVCIDAMFNTPYSIQIARIETICTHKDIQKVHVDKGGIGHPIAERLNDELGNISEGIQIGPASKGPLVETFRGFVNQRRVMLPNDPDIRQDILSMRRVAPKTQGGAIRYEGGTDKTHADYYIAAALGLDAAIKAAGITLAMPAREEEDEISWLAS